jgi:alpha-glucuronidase
MRVYHLRTTIELEDTDDNYFEDMEREVSIGHYRTFDEAIKHQLELRKEWDSVDSGWYSKLIGEKSDD